MTKALRKSIPAWYWITGVFLIAVGSIGWFSFNKPLPEYLVAIPQILPGEPLTLDNLDSVALDLGPLASKYLQVGDITPGLQVIDTVAPGELIAISEVTTEVASNQTSIRLRPSLEISSVIKAGSWVSIWRVVEGEAAFISELLIPRGKVSRVIEPEGLLISEGPEVELVVDMTASTLILESISAEQDIYLLPLP